MQALLVFILYVRCTAINPADPGIMSKFDPELTQKAREKHGSLAQGLPIKFDEMSNGTHSPSSSASRSSRAGANSSKNGSVESVRTASQVISPRRKSSCHDFGGIFCVMFVHEDCCKSNDAAEQEGTGEDALFCTLCNAEVANGLPRFSSLIYFSQLCSQRYLSPPPHPKKKNGKKKKGSEWCGIAVFLHVLYIGKLGSQKLYSLPYYVIGDAITPYKVQLILLNISIATFI